MILKIGQNNKKSVSSPQLFLESAKWWEDLYTNNKDINNLMAPICLFFALEFYLKAYLINLNSEFSDNEKIKKLGHNFNKIFTAITKKEKGQSFLEKIKESINNYNLFNNNVIELRYPYHKKMTVWDGQLLSGEHKFTDLFEKIKQTINQSKNISI